MSGRRRLTAAVLSVCVLFAADRMILHADNDTVSVQKEEEAEVIHISTPEELCAFRDRVNNGETDLNAVLDGDIVLNPGTFDSSGQYVSESGESLAEWIPIGSEEHPYAGIFDGNGFTVSGIYVGSGTANQGFFGSVNRGTIWNLTLTNGLIIGSEHTGGIAGHIVSSVIENCRNGVFVSAEGNMNGGIAGLAEYSKITFCVNEGSLISGSYQNGGIAGHAEHSEISFCVNRGNLTVLDHAGGIAAYNVSGTVKNCINYGDVTTSNSWYTYTAGIVANNVNPDSVVENCLNLGDLSGSLINGSRVSAVVCAADASGSWAENCYSVELEGYDFGLSSGFFAREDDLSSGRIAWLLGDGFGQIIGEDPVPVFRNAENQVFTLQYDLNGIQGMEQPDAVYANSGREITLLEPAEAGMFWTLNGSRVSSVTVQDADMTVMAEAVMPEISSDQTRLFQFVTGDDVSIRLLDYIQNQDETGSCSFLLKSGSSLPAGLSLGGDGVLSGNLQQGGTAETVFVIRNPYGAEAELTLTFHVEEQRYTVRIPADASLGDTVEISAEDVVLRSGMSLAVSLSADAENGFSVSNTAGDILPYTILQDNRLVQLNDIVLKVQSCGAAGTEGSASILLQEPDSAAQFAGSYQGTLVFHISVEEGTK